MIRPILIVALLVSAPAFAMTSAERMLMVANSNPFMVGEITPCFGQLTLTHPAGHGTLYVKADFIDPVWNVTVYSDAGYTNRVMSATRNLDLGGPALTALSEEDSSGFSGTIALCDPGDGAVVHDTGLIIY